MRKFAFSENRGQNDPVFPVPSRSELATQSAPWITDLPFEVGLEKEVLAHLFFCQSYRRYPE